MSGENTPKNPGRRVVQGVSRVARPVIAQVRRHWLTAFAALLVALFVLGPGFTANRSSFYVPYEYLGEYHETWVMSTHANVSCQSCHVPPGTIAQSIYSVRMVGEIYRSLLPSEREPSTLGTPTNAACDQCHIDLRTVSPAGDLLIPHAAHVEMLEVACVVCHVVELVHNDDPTISTTPRMDTCLTCHDGTIAKADCEACHTDKGIPESHQDPLFLIDHSERQDEIDCVSCHAWKDDWCVECHARRPSSHGTGAILSEWRKAHRDVVYVRELRNCEACHESAFCSECHGEVPARNLDPAISIVR